jgi:hypothetical protein
MNAEEVFDACEDAFSQIEKENESAYNQWCLSMKNDFERSQNDDHTSDETRNAEAKWTAVLARRNAAEQQILAIRGIRKLADMRRAGWSVAVHNDYRINGERMTFWLFTRGHQAVKGEGATDALAIDDAARLATALGMES